MADAAMENQTDPFHLRRFVDAQKDMYAQVSAELAAGQKRSHWMWFIFPQIQGLGSSSMAQRYAISDLREAKAYLAHPVLGMRLRECTGLVIAAAPRSVSAIFGYPDDMKFHSSMTLFAQVGDGTTAENEVFSKALATFFAGKPDQATLARL